MSGRCIPAASPHFISLLSHHLEIEVIPSIIDINTAPSYVRGVVSKPPFVHLGYPLTPFPLIHIISDTQSNSFSTLPLIRRSTQISSPLSLRRTEARSRKRYYVLSRKWTRRPRERTLWRKAMPSRCYGRCELPRCHSRSSTPPLPPLSSIINDPSFKNAGPHLFPWTGTPLCHLFRGIHTFRFSRTASTPGGTTVV